MRGDLTVYTATGNDMRKRQPRTIRADIFEDLALHKDITRGTWTITHRPTGYAIAAGWKKRKDAFAAINRVNFRLRERGLAIAEGSVTKSRKCPLMKQVALYLIGAKRVANNEGIEAIAGVFWADRQDVQALFNAIGE